jgi:endonuclease/exonuclease/phosphatase family metal-dependent hydrolase
MSIKIASWNIEGRLSGTGAKRRGTPEKIIDMIRRINADVLVLIEAHGETSLDNLKSRQKLQDMGYHLNNVPYQDDTPSRADTSAELLSLMLLSKFPVEKFDIIRLGDFRNAFSAQIQYKEQSFRIFGIHLDDRQETTRLKQIDDLEKIINQSKLPTVVVGDFNAMHGDDIWPKLLHSRPVKSLAKLLVPAISLRASEMATGNTLRLLQLTTGLTDADPRHRPTTTPKMRGQEWLPSIRLIQIDHIFVSKKIKVNNFKIMPDGGADHRAIVAELSL